MFSKKLFLLFILLITSCEVHDLTLDEIVYSNDFEKNSNLEKIAGGIISNYNGYNLLKHKISENILTKRFNIIINENDVQSYVDYYIDSLCTE